MRIGLGPRTGEVYDLLGAAGKSVLEVAQLVQRRFLEWPNGPSQDDVKALEHVIPDLADAPNALIGLLAGKNFGKVVVRVGPDELA